MPRYGGLRGYMMGFHGSNDTESVGEQVSSRGSLEERKISSWSHTPSVAPVDL